MNLSPLTPGILGFALILPPAGFIWQYLTTNYDGWQ